MGDLSLREEEETRDITNKEVLGPLRRRGIRGGAPKEGTEAPEYPSELRNQAENQIYDSKFELQTVASGKSPGSIVLFMDLVL